MAGSVVIRGLKKSYIIEGRINEVLKGVDLEIPKGSIAVLLGKSGCGKTTILRLVSGLEKPDEGSITVGDDNRTAYVFQEARLMPWKNVYDNVTFGLKKKDIDKAEINHLIDMVGLSDYKKAFPNQLSGGMQQRCSIARAMAVQPSLILMDEPFAALDHFTRLQMQEELLDMHKKTGASILFVTHNVDEALNIGDQILVLSDGIIRSRIDIIKKDNAAIENENYIALKKELLDAIQ